MDLSQAEAVADLIASTSAATHRMAMNQMRGGFSRELALLRDQLLHLTSLMELELDFSDHEDLEFADRSELEAIAARVEQVIARLADTFSVGNALKNGVPVAIVGETNAGKSTLLNALLNEERAIVSDIHGTTRDVIEDTLSLGGITFRFIDTAGIRQTTDTIESLGIERSFQKLEQADIVLWVIDATRAREQYRQLRADILPRCEGKHLVLVLNKADLPPQADIDLIRSEFPETVVLSASQGSGAEELEKSVARVLSTDAFDPNAACLTSERQRSCCVRAIDDLSQAVAALESGVTLDAVNVCAECAVGSLLELTGEKATDAVVDEVFSRFCVGK